MRRLSPKQLRARARIDAALNERVADIEGTPDVLAQANELAIDAFGLAYSDLSPQQCLTLAEKAYQLAFPAMGRAMRKRAMKLQEQPQ